MASRELIILGTASQAPTRLRAHNGYVLRWDDQLLLFDPGEGAQRQCILAGVSVAKLTGICITHFHGDHCLGLPGIIQRRALDARSRPGGLEPLPVFFPADGAEYLERMRKVSIFHDASDIRAVPVHGPGPVGKVGSLEIRAEPLEHRVTTFGYRVTEPDRPSLDPVALAAHGLDGPDVGRLIKDGSIDTAEGTVELQQVSSIRSGQSMAFIMDTVDCPGARSLAQGVDLAVIESTFLEEHRLLAEQYLHLTAGQAAQIAADSAVRRLVLSHFSARYTEPGVFASEASAFHPDVVEGADLLRIAVPGHPGVV